MKKLTCKQRHQLQLDIGDQLGENRECKGYEKKAIEEIILYDLEALKDAFQFKSKGNFNYHFKLLKGNLKDYFKKGQCKCNHDVAAEKK